MNSTACSNKTTIIPVVLAGGVGSRLWPASRKLYPKQFQDMLGQGESFFQATLNRIKNLPNCGKPIIVCNEEHRFLVAEQLRQSDWDDAVIILEPVGKNTAPAVALAAHHALAHSQNSILLVMPADHVIEGQENFYAAIQQAQHLAEQEYMVTFGVTPTAPETGYGYIKTGESLLSDSAYVIHSFKEKPDLHTAENYLREGGYFWNSGMFMFRPSIYLQQLELHASDIYQNTLDVFNNIEPDLDFLRLSKDIFTRCRSDSIDYAVMESTQAAVVVPLSVKWNDVGAWSALWEVSPHDSEGNSTHGDVLLKSCHNTLVRAESRLVAAIGLDNFIIAETADAVFISPKDNSQEVKEIVSHLSNKQRDEINAHTRVYRPWGWYESICSSQRFQVKRIMVKPGASLSLQLHHHRAEHWIIVSGTAHVTREDEVATLREDQSTYIPLGTRHRLKNPGVIPLEIIEVQTGSYLGEDDIVRFEDHYGRSK